MLFGKELPILEPWKRMENFLIFVLQVWGRLKSEYLVEYWWIWFPRFESEEVFERVAAMIMQTICYTELCNFRMKFME